VGIFNTQLLWWAQCRLYKPVEFLRLLAHDCMRLQHQPCWLFTQLKFSLVRSLHWRWKCCYVIVKQCTTYPYAAATNPWRTPSMPGTHFKCCVGISTSMLALQLTFTSVYVVSYMRRIPSLNSGGQRVSCMCKGYHYVMLTMVPALLFLHSLMFRTCACPNQTSTYSGLPLHCTMLPTLSCDFLVLACIHACMTSFEHSP
jgi:hypothetical protein